MDNELKLIEKILEDNKMQINNQNIELKSILSNITTDTSHKESKPSTTTNTMNETITCIGENDKNEQKQEQKIETKTNPLGEKCPNKEFFRVRIFLYSD